jgi:hypothetical protein
MSTEHHLPLAGTVLWESALVRTVDAKVGESIRSVAQHEYPRQRT